MFLFIYINLIIGCCCFWLLWPNSELTIQNRKIDFTVVLYCLFLLLLFEYLQFIVLWIYLYENGNMKRTLLTFAQRNCTRAERKLIECWIWNRWHSVGFNAAFYYPYSHLLMEFLVGYWCSGAKEIMFARRVRISFDFFYYVKYICWSLAVFLTIYFSVLLVRCCLFSFLWFRFAFRRQFGWILISLILNKECVCAVVVIVVVVML